jgi:competence protein ComEC
MTHIVAVSGYNILLVAGLLLFIAVLLGVWRKTALWSALLGVGVFILFVGAPASAVRAGSMAGFSFLALASGRRSAGFMVLLVSASLMLLWNPLLLFYDIGFQLSFLALVGILFSLPEEMSQSTNVVGKIGEAIKVTLWVESFVLPVILYQFGTLAWFSLVANIVLMPLIPLAMLGALLLVIVGLSIPAFLLPLVSAPVYGVLWMIIRFVEYFGEWPYIALNNFFIPVYCLGIWYSLLIIFGVLQLRYAKKKWYAEAFVVHDTTYPYRTSFFGR